MAVAASRLEPGAHAALKRRPAGLGDEGRAPFEDIDELVLLRVRMAQSRTGAGRKARDVDAEIREPEQVPKRTLVASGHARGERLGIIGAKRSLRRLSGAKGDWTFAVLGHWLPPGHTIARRLLPVRVRSSGPTSRSLHEAPEQEGVMEGFLIRAAVVAVGLWLASKMGLVAFNSTGTLIAAALLLGVVNAFVRPIIIILTLPITLLTLGLFLLVINALMIMLVAWLVPGFLVAGFWSAVFAAIVVSLTSWVMSGWIGPRGRVEIVTVQQPGGRGRW